MEGRTKQLASKGSQPTNQPRTRIAICMQQDASPPSTTTTTTAQTVFPRGSKSAHLQAALEALRAAHSAAAASRKDNRTVHKKSGFKALVRQSKKICGPGAQGTTTRGAVDGNSLIRRVAYTLLYLCRCLLFASARVNDSVAIILVHFELCPLLLQSLCLLPRLPDYSRRR